MKELKYLGDSKVQVRNQIVIPKNVADSLKIEKGDKVGFFAVEGNDDMIVIAKISAELRPGAKFCEKCGNRL